MAKQLAYAALEDTGGGNGTKPATTLDLTLASLYPVNGLIPMSIILLDEDGDPTRIVQLDTGVYITLWEEVLGGPISPYWFRLTATMEGNPVEMRPSTSLVWVTELDYRVYARGNPLAGQTSDHIAFNVVDADDGKTITVTAVFLTLEASLSDTEDTVVEGQFIAEPLNITVHENQLVASATASDSFAWIKDCRNEKGYDSCKEVAPVCKASLDALPIGPASVDVALVNPCAQARVDGPYLNSVLSPTLGRFDYLFRRSVWFLSPWYYQNFVRIQGYVRIRGGAARNNWPVFPEGPFSFRIYHSTQYHSTWAGAKSGNLVLDCEIDFPPEAYVDNQITVTPNMAFGAVNWYQVDVPWSVDVAPWVSPVPIPGQDPHYFYFSLDCETVPVVPLVNENRVPLQWNGTEYIRATSTTMWMAAYFTAIYVGGNIAGATPPWVVPAKPAVTLVLWLRTEYQPGSDIPFYADFFDEDGNRSLWVYAPDDSLDSLAGNTLRLSATLEGPAVTLRKGGGTLAATVDYTIGADGLGTGHDVAGTLGFNVTVGDVGKIITLSGIETEYSLSDTVTTTVVLQFT